MIWLLPIINLVAVFATTGVSIYWLLANEVKRKAQRLMPELPAPEGDFALIGHSHHLLHCKTTTDLWNTINEFLDYYKDGCQFYVGHKVWLLMTDTDVIQEVLASPDALDKSYIYQILNVITDGVLIAPGVRWRKLRKRLNLTFSVKKIDSYMDTVNEHTEVMLKVVLKRLQQEDKHVDIQPYIARCLFDIITSTHFGTRTDEQVRDQYQAVEIISLVIELIMEKRGLKPHLHSDFIFQFSELYKFINKIKVKPINYFITILEARMKQMESAKSSGQVKSSEEREVPLYVEMVVETLKELNIPPTIYNINMNSGDLIIAGSDTTSVAVAALLYHLALNKEMQERVYDEVSRLYGSDSFRPLTRQDLASLSYLDMAMNEALRWAAPPGIIRQMNNDVDVAKYTIPKAASVYVMIGTLNRNPDYYERVNEFYPEHFTSEAVKSRPKMAFIPFSAGPRNCPGKQFANVLFKSTIAVIVNNYILETNLPLDQVRRKMILMTQHVQGYPIRFVPRNHHISTSVLEHPQSHATSSALVPPVSH